MSNVYFNGFLLTLGLIMAIGAQNAHVLRQGLRGEHVLLTIGVSAACDILLIGLGIAGVGSLFVANPDLMTVARYGGAAFLVWYGTRALLSALRGGRALDLAEHRRMSRGQALLAAAGFSLLNPHAYLDTVVLLGSIGSQQAEDLRPLFAKPVAWRVLDALVALMLWAIAASLLLA